MKNNLMSFFSGAKKTLNPAYAMSPFMLRTTSIEQLKSEIEPVIYQGAETIDCPEFMDMSVPPNMQHLQAPSHTSPIADFRVVKNLIYIAEYPSKNLLLSDDRKFIIESSSTMRAPGHFKWTHAYRSVYKTYSGLCMVFRGVSNNYYHTIIDNLPRLMALHHPSVQQLGEVKLLVTNKLTVVEAELMKRVLPENVTIEFVESNRAYRLEQCLFPSFATQQYSGYVSSVVQEWMQQCICPKRPRSRDKLIYISRSLAPHRRLLNEEDIVERLKKHNFKIYTLENINFMDQVELFYDARCVVGLHGAGFTNVIFSKGVNVVEIFPYQYTKPSYYLMTKAVGGKYYYVTGTGDQINIDVSISPDKVEKMVLSALSN